MDMSNIAIGNRIREIRIMKGFTLEQLAEYAEISTNFLWEIETGRKSMKVQSLGKLAAALNVPTDYLIFGSTLNKNNEKMDLMLSSLSGDLQEQLEKIITAFVDTVIICNGKKNENDSSEEKE